MDSLRRVALVVLFSTTLLPQCMPDFDALSAGPRSGSGGSVAGDGSGGSEISNGGMVMPDASGGSSPNSNSGGTSSGGGSLNSNSGETSSGGSSPNAGSGGNTSGGTNAAGTTAGGSEPVQAGGMDGGAGLGGASAGAAGEPGCVSFSDVATYSAFDDGLDGNGFASSSIDSVVDTTHAASSTSGWDSLIGNRCPGSLQYSYVFKAYAVNSDPDEVGFGNYFFASMNWSSVSAVHAMVKVSPANAPITGVRFFVLSGSQYLYDSVLDSTRFKSGGWNEMILRPVAGSSYDPTDVYRLGVEIRLLRAGSLGIPAQTPKIEVWLDDIWLEPK
jgi:hypothetical protein